MIPPSPKEVATLLLKAADCIDRLHAGDPAADETIADELRDAVRSGDELRFFTGTYSHRHGYDAFAFTCYHEPTQQEIVDALGLDFEEGEDIDWSDDTVTHIPEPPEAVQEPYDAEAQIKHLQGIIDELTASQGVKFLPSSAPLTHIGTFTPSPPIPGQEVGRLIPPSTLLERVKLMTPEDVAAAIEATHPVTLDTDEGYQLDTLAMWLIHGRHDKREIVNLIRWCLMGCPPIPAVPDPFACTCADWGAMDHLPSCPASWQSAKAREATPPP